VAIVIGSSRSTHGALAYLAVAATQRGIGFVVLPVFAATLTPEGYGQVATLLSLYGLATMLLPAGLDTPLFRAMFMHDAPAEREEYRSTLVTALFAGPILLGAFGGIAVAIGPPLFGLPSRYIATYAVMAGLFTASSVAPLAILRATERFGAFAALSLSYAGAQLFLRFSLVVIADMGVRGWIIADLCSTLLALALSLIWQGRFISLRRVRSHHLRAGLSVGLPVVPHAAAHWVLNLSDRLILAAFWSSTIVGIYSVGYQIAFIAGMAATEVNRAFMPRYGAAIGDMSARDALSGHARQHIVITVAVAALVALFGPQVVHFLLPHVYAEAAALIPLVALGFCFLGTYYVPMNLISIVAGRTTWIWIPTLCAATVNVAANLSLVPHFGMVAAAANTSAGYLVLLLVVVAMARKLCPEVRLDLRPIVLLVASILAAAVVGSVLSVRPGMTGFVAACCCGVLIVVLVASSSGGRFRSAAKHLQMPGELYV
jgi:O-antigen/teichoic acid export membrane protein